MNDVTSILSAIESGQAGATEDLLPLVYAELRRLAAHKLSREPRGQTLQATALVHEAWLRLAGPEDQRWESRRHFFAAAAEAMRRILVDRARREQSIRHGGQLQRVDIDDIEIASPLPDDDLLALHEALDQLAILDPPAADLIKLRFFTGLTHEQAAETLGLSRSAADRAWVFARAWLFKQVRPEKS